MTIIADANLSFFFNDNKKRIYHSGLVVDFSIRKDMFNSGKIEFIDKKVIFPGENGVKAKIIFAYGELVRPFLKEGSKYIFGEPIFPYGECLINKILLLGI